MSEDEDLESPTDESGENNDDPEVRIELTPEQKAALSRTLEGIQQTLARNIEFPKFTLPDSTLMNIFAVSRIAESQQAMVASVIKPLADMQQSWQKQFASISSDIFKSYSLVQPTLNLVASQLTKNIDFSAFAGAARVAEQFASQQATWLKNIAPALASMRAAFYPHWDMRLRRGCSIRPVRRGRARCSGCGAHGGRSDTRWHPHRCDPDFVFWEGSL